MEFDSLLKIAAECNAAIAKGPIVPSVAPAEIRTHLSSRYDFTKPLELREVVDDVEQMLQSWQVQVTHPRYMGLFNPSVTEASVVADTPYRDLQPPVGRMADLSGRKRNRAAYAGVVCGESWDFQAAQVRLSLPEVLKQIFPQS